MLEATTYNMARLVGIYRKTKLMIVEKVGLKATKLSMHQMIGIIIKIIY